MSIDFRSELGDDRAVLYCAGQLRVGDETDRLREFVTRLFCQRSKIVLDLGQVQEIDSGALSVLVGLYSTARTAKGEIEYRNLTIPVRYIKPTSLQTEA